jgi:hypothetical protein
MNFSNVARKFEDVLFGFGYYHDWGYHYLYFYINDIKCFYIDYDNKKFGYKNRIDDEFFTEYEFAFYTTEENIKNFIETIQQKAADFIKFYKKEKVIKNKLDEIEKDFV